MTITPDAKRLEATRLLHLYQRTFPGKVARGVMDQAEADHRIDVVKAMVADYPKEAPDGPE